MFLVPLTLAPPGDGHDSSREMANERTDSRRTGADAQAASPRSTGSQQEQARSDRATSFHFCSAVFFPQTTQQGTIVIYQRVLKIKHVSVVVARVIMGGNFCLVSALPKQNNENVLIQIFVVEKNFGGHKSWHAGSPGALLRQKTGETFLLYWSISVWVPHLAGLGPTQRRPL